MTCYGVGVVPQVAVAGEVRLQIFVEIVPDPT
jgi:hypothetical protein